MKCPDWLADSAKQLGPIKKENFDTSIPIGDCCIEFIYEVVAFLISGNGLGKGKFGLVFIGRHSNGSKHVAIKYIPKQIIFETQSSTRIQQVRYMCIS